MKELQLNNQQRDLFDFVKEMHGEQVRKYTFEPYWTHLFSVASLYAPYAVQNGIEIALCHDLFEDTECDDVLLHKFLLGLSYTLRDANAIVKGVEELTDFYTKARFPQYNRAERKQKEAVRLGGINTMCQSIKYADLIDNSKSILKFDPKFGAVYLQEKIAVLDQMRSGDIMLLIQCCHSLQSGLNALSRGKDE